MKQSIELILSVIFMLFVLDFFAVIHLAAFKGILIVAFVVLGIAKLVQMLDIITSQSTIQDK
ncbi:hypothetical protein [Macrococcus sp. DPC7161]|uniref:hypothetical protein n=1 Tax=Macrococcus sp. DPC7161 TaxID=2507060 RepID=UPI00100A7BBC|nr:hypothetical protein [Macrococcus sp. DPC7161]RXK17469.1 hypothetical protein ER639_10010 [Macrococcus sp. DPC7161]